MTCDRCDDTGSLSKDMHGYRDCTRCGVAEERDALEAWLIKNAPYCECDDATAWLIYLHGKTAALNT